MNIFKHEHPSNLISRLFMLEYIREIGADTLYTKANKYQKEKFFYKFSSDDGVEALDINYEYCLFIATLHELEGLLKFFLDELEEIEAQRAETYKVEREKLLEEQAVAPVDINIMDLAQTEINKNDGNKLIL